MKKYLLITALFFSAFARDIGWDQGGDRNIGWDQTESGGASATLSLIYKSDAATQTTYAVRCSLYTDTGAIIRLYDSASGSWTAVDSSVWFDDGEHLDTLGRTALTAETEYFYRVIAQDSSGQYDTIALDSITTLPNAPNISYAAASCTTDVSFSINVSSTGGTADSMNCIDALPTGLAITKTGANIGRDSGTCLLVVPLPATNYRVVAYNAGGTDTANLSLTVVLNPQIWVDHRHVDFYDNIPDRWMDSARTKLMNVLGESHGRGYFYGLTLVDTMGGGGTGEFAVKTNWTGAPYAENADTLRGMRTWWNGSWQETGGEEDWYTSAAAIATLNDHIGYCATTLSNPIDLMLFGWCWDMTWHNDPGGTEDPVYYVHWAGSSVGGPEGDLIWGLDAGDEALTSNTVTMQDYLDATKYYGNENPGTKVVFTTGTQDNLTSDESGYQRFLKQQFIREYVRDSSGRALFDYADILDYNNAGVQYVDGDGWTDGNSVFHTYPTIQAVNKGTYDGGEGDCHLSDSGCIRIGKALWYLTARVSGWDGDTTTTTVQTWYVSKDGDNTNGTSLAHAWDEMDQIEWDSLVSGDTLILDTGTYTTSLQVNKNNIYVKFLATDTTIISEHILIHGDSTTIDGVDSSLSFFELADPQTGYGIQVFDTCPHFTIKNMHIVGNCTGVGTGTHLYIQCDTATVYGCFFDGGSYEDMIKWEGDKGKLLISHSRFKSPCDNEAHADALQITSGDTCNLDFEYSIIEDFDGQGFMITVNNADSSAGVLNLKYCLFDNVGSGVLKHKEVTFKGLVVSNCTYNNTYTSESLAGCDSIYYTNCIFNGVNSSGDLHTVVTDTAGTVFNNCLWGLDVIMTKAGTGNIFNTAPGFDTAVTFVPDTFSACYAAGTDLGYTVDLAGVAVADVPTIGAYEASGGEPPTQYTLTVTDDGHGSTTGGGVQDSGVVGGNIVATADPGYLFVNWTVTIGTATITNASAATTTVTLSSDATVQANFAIKTYKLTISNAGHGETDPSGEITVDTGAATNIEAIPYTGYEFDHWRSYAGNPVFADSTDPTTTVVCNEPDVEVLAMFKLKQYTLTMAVNAGGTTVPSVGAHAVDSNAPTSLLHQPVSGKAFKNWDTTGLGAVFVSALTVNSNTVRLSASVTVTAIDTTKQFHLIISASPAGLGTIVPAIGDTMVDSGAVVGISQTELDTNSFIEWTATGGVAIAGDGLSITVTGAGTLTANYQPTASATTRRNRGWLGLGLWIRP